MTKNSLEYIPPDLQIAKKLVYEPCGLIIDKLKEEAESKDYEAYDFEMNLKRVKFRAAKITPTKIGQFVTLWKRIGTGPILPFDISDSIDLFIISVRYGERLGQFVFPKAILYQKGIVSKDGKGGKRAMRVYPSWDKTDNKQAKKTQEWQLVYFFEIDMDTSLNTSHIQRLFF